MVGVLLLAAVTLLGHTRTESSPVHRSALQAAQGRVVYDADLTSRKSGWVTGALRSGSSFTYTSRGFTATMNGNLLHSETAPFRTPFANLGVSTTAVVDTPAPVAGFGVECLAGTGDTRVRYQFEVHNNGAWFILRVVGATVAVSHPVVLASGLGARLGRGPHTIEGVCHRHGTVRADLTMFLDGFQVDDLSDAPPDGIASGFFGGVVARSSAARQTVTFSRFVARDRSGA